MITLSYNGKTYESWDKDNLLAVGVPESVINEKLTEDQWHEVRIKRDALIAQCDWTQMPDAVLTDEQKAAFTTYRQALRDIPQTFSDPAEITWPEKPAS